MGVQNTTPSLESKNYKKKEKAILTKSTKSPKNLLVFYTNADKKINKRNEFNQWFLQIIRTYFVPPKFCQKTFY